jgi:type II secretory pathway pseudopilin PulG
MMLRGQQGYAMVALLVGMTIMAVLMTVVMPTWKQAAQREKEAELIFRGQQYARAVGLFQRRAGPGVLPPNVDVLVDGRFLRKAYKDPITGEDFDLLTATQDVGAGASAEGPGGGRQGAVAAPASVAGRGAASTPVARGGILGVASKSKDASIRIYNGRTHYNEWQFVYVAQAQAPGQGAGVGGQPERGGQGLGRGGAGEREGRGRGGMDVPSGRGPGQQITPFGGRGGFTPPAGSPVPPPQR